MSAGPPNVIKGDGLSSETAVLFEPCSVAARVKAEHEFICQRYGTENIHWFRSTHFTTSRFQSNWMIELDSGESVSLYFEIGDTIYE